MGSGTHESEKVIPAENPAQAASLPAHPLKPVIRRLVRNAPLLGIAFVLVHFLGFEKYVSVLSGTASFGIFQRMAGALYAVLYLCTVFLAPVLLVAAALLEIILLATKNKYADQSNGNVIFCGNFRKFRKWGKCNCKTLQNYVNSPIQYDPKLNEYSICYDDDRGAHCKIRMYFCFFCGGRLPKSNRDKLFTKPSVIEKFKAGLLVRNVKTEEDIIRILGEPDQKMSFVEPSFSELPEDEISKKILPDGLKAQYNYTSGWKTLDIVFSIYKNGKISISFFGKYIG